MNLTRCAWTTIVALAITTTNAFGQDAPAISGPMVGHTTDSSAIVWMYAPKNSKLALILEEELPYQIQPATSLASPTKSHCKN